MKDPNVEALNKRTRTDVIITLVLSGVFACNAVFQLLARHDFSKAFSSLFLFVISLLTGLIFTDIRKNGKPFAKSVIRKLRIIALTVCCSGYLMQFADCIADGIGKKAFIVDPVTGIICRRIWIRSRKGGVYGNHYQIGPHDGGPQNVAQ